MTHINEEPVLDYPEGATDRAPFRRLPQPLPLAFLIFALIAAGGIVVLGVTSSKTSSRSVSAPEDDFCAHTAEAAEARGKLVYTLPRNMTEVTLSSNGPEDFWCVFGTPLSDGLWWGAVFVGDANPLYRAMTATTEGNPESVRAILMYQSLPPIKFAQDGWIGFITSDDGRSWTAEETASAARGLLEVSRKAEK